MDAALAGLIGVCVGGLATVGAAFVGPWVAARQSVVLAQRESEQKKQESLEAALDQAGLALEAVHWALNDALDVTADARTAGEKTDELRAAYGRLAEAQAEASRQGTRLAIRLGPPSSSRCVQAYNARQRPYRRMVRRVRSTDLSGLDVAGMRKDLDELGQDESFFVYAAEILKPIALD